MTGHVDQCIEASWGADPLEYYGGFRALEYDPESRFKSSLAANGTVGWALFDASDVEHGQNGARVSLEVAFPVNWTFLQTVYGWAALQYQAWARTMVFVTADSVQTVALYTDHVLEFWLDGKHHFGGDFYAYRKAALVLHLKPGRHILDLRLLRDVRVMGGTGDPTIQIAVELKAVAGVLELAKDDLLVSDVVDGRLASPFGSLPVRNNALEPVEIVGIHAVDVSRPVCTQPAPD